MSFCTIGDWSCAYGCQPLHLVVLPTSHLYENNYRFVTNSVHVHLWSSVIVVWCNRTGVKTNLRDSHAEFCLQFAACRYFHNTCSGFGFRLLCSGWITKQPRSWVFECIIKPHGASKRMLSEHSNRYLIEEWLLQYDVMILSRLCAILLSHSGCPNE